MTITSKPSPLGAGRVQLFDGDRCIVDTPADKADAAAQHYIDTMAKHFGDVYARQQAGDERLVVAQHMGRLMVFSIGSPNDEPRGFGGDVWHIYFKDGRYVKCCSLWCLGDIPPNWQDRIVANARFGHGVKLRRW